MNQTVSKTTAILRAIRKILISDTTNTGYEVREVSFYVSNRIVQGTMPAPVNMPHITLSEDDGDQRQLLPSGEYFVPVRCWVDMDTDSPNDTINNLVTRIIFLLHNKQDQLNTQYPSDNLRCRLITKQSNTLLNDGQARLISRTILFRVIADDEILVC